MIADANGMYRFENLPAGSYRLSVPDADFVRAGITLDGYNQVRIDVARES